MIDFYNENPFLGSQGPNPTRQRNPSGIVGSQWDPSGTHITVSSYLKTQRGTCDSLKVCGMQIHLLKTDAGLSV